MSAQKYAITAWRGDTYTRSFAFTQDGSPLSFAGATITVQVKKKSTDTVNILEFKTGGAGITVAANVITLDKLVDVPAGAYVYDFEVTFASGSVRTFLYGPFTVTQDTTRTP
jgi:hypothetical protein